MMQTKSKRRAAAKSRTVGNVVQLPPPKAAPPAYRPPASAPLPGSALTSTGYLLVTRLHVCDCGNQWLHSEFFRVETAQATLGLGAHRRVPVKSQTPLAPNLLVGTSKLQNAYERVCPVCVDRVAAEQQGSALPPLDPVEFARAAQRAAEPPPSAEPKPVKPTTSLEDIA